MAQQNESGNEGMIIGIGALVVLFGGWYLFGKQLTTAYLFWKKAEMLMLEWTGIPFLFPEKWSAKVLAFAPIFQKNPADIKIAELQALGAGIGYFTSWYFAAALGFVGWKILQRNPLSKFRRSFKMKTLAESEQRLWPAITPVVKLDLVEESIEKGPWAMAKRPLDFSRHYKLLDEGNKLNRERAEKLFAAQLGKLWEGPEKLPANLRALFAIFAAQACGDLEEAKKGLDTLSRTMVSGKPDYSFVPGMLKKYGSHEKVAEICSKHAYVYTVMASLLEAARGFGVLASAQFIWLRPTNRLMWYTLNGVGRRVAFCEVGGIYAHWISEKVAEHAIERPYVIKAVDGLERALYDVKFD